ncbi:class II aldolase/adducin family protein [Myxococcota bacterium]|nr:class II aldolase/adducin family protein [Myxococcota bacterium]
MSDEATQPHTERPTSAPALPRHRTVGMLVEGRAVAYRFDGTATVVDEHGSELTTGDLRFRWLLPTDGGRLAACTVDFVYGHLDRDGHFTAVRGDCETEARLELTRISHLLYERNYNVSIDGNVSYRLDDGTLLVTPTGAHLGFIRPEDFVVMDSDGRLLRGSISPTSEYRLHVDVHRQRPDCRCVVHVHSPYALAASLAGIDLHKTYVTVAPIPTTPYARISSPETPAVLGSYLKDYNWAIIPRHGVVTWADTPWNAFLRVEGLEHCAKIVVSAQAAGTIEPMSPQQRSELLGLWGLEHLEDSDG